MWRGSRLGKVPNPSHGEVRREEDEEKGPRLHGCADCCKFDCCKHHEPCRGRHHHRSRCGSRTRRRAFLPRVRAPRAARPGLRLRGVFRPAGDRVRLLGLRNRRAPGAHRSGPREHLALCAAAARPGRRRRQAEHQPRLDQARQGRQPRPRAGRRVRQALRQGRLRQPDALLQGPRRRPGHRSGPRLRLHHPLLLLHRQPQPAPSVPPPPGPVSAPACSSRTTWSRARSSWPRSTAASSSASRATTTT